MSPHSTGRFVAVLLTVAAVLLAAPAAALPADEHGDDWEHAVSVVGRLAADPPGSPVVYLLGGSSARESTVSDAGWRRQIADKGVPDVRACNLGSSGQTYAQGLWLVRQAPDVPTLVLIGVNVGRYTPRIRPVDDDGAAAARASSGGRGYDQHRFSTARSVAVKRALVAKWLRERYPLFKERYADHAAALAQLVAACRERGFRPVLVELPLDESLVGSAWDAARHRYARDCRDVAAEYRVPYVDFVGRIGLVTPDFHDLTHLIAPGRVKWQERLSRLVVKRLAQYGLDSAAVTRGEFASR